MRTLGGQTQVTNAGVVTATDSFGGREVAFSVDGRRRATVTAKARRKVFSLRIDPRKQGYGVHRVASLVRFTSASGTAARNLRLVYQRCPRSAVRPQFTG